MDAAALGEWDSILMAFLLQCYNHCRAENIEFSTRNIPEGVEKLLGVATAVETLEFGQAIGQLTRELLRKKADAAQAQLVEQHGLDVKAAANLLSYLHDQVEATGEAPSDQTIVVESF